MPQFRTNAQNKQMFGLASKAGLSHDDLRDWADEISNGRTNSTSKLYTNEAREIIARLKAVVDPGQTPRRTVNYRKRKSNVETLVSQAQLAKLQDLADGRGMSNEGLRKLCLRMLKKERPHTTKEANKVIEAIKAMNQRDRWGATKPASKEAA